MALDQTAGVGKGIREALPDILAPDIRELRADIRAIRDRLEVMDKRFDDLDGDFSIDRDVQTLKEQMAEIRARQQPSA